MTSVNKDTGSADSIASQETVTVVITTFNDHQFLPDAVNSVLAQTRAVDQVIVVDDGSDQSPAVVLEAFPSVTLFRKNNGGLASARNFGLQHATSTYICFLDVDDRLTPNAIQSGLACFRANPEAAMVYGAHYRIGPDAERAGRNVYKPLGAEPYEALLTGNLIGMHATALFRSAHLLTLGGYDKQLRRGEDYDLYLRFAQKYPIASHPETVAEYRWHGQNMSIDTRKMLETILSIHDRHRPEDAHRLELWHRGRRFWREWYGGGQQTSWGAGAKASAPKSPAWDRAIGLLRNVARKTLPRHLLGLLPAGWPPRLGQINFGSLAGPRPVSMDFGWDRGTPVDRYYIENFLREHSQDIRGRVLEIGDDAYSRRFGTGITQQDILHVTCEDPKVTITGDITTRGVLPENAFDCIIFTQTLHVIFELDAAIQELHAALKPSGILLLTVPGVSQVDRQEWGANWCWSFTPTSVRRLFEPVFGSSTQVAVYGNVFAAICFLTGAVQEEIETRKLDVYDPAYPVIITLRAQKL